MARKLSKMAEARELIAKIHKLMDLMYAHERAEITTTYDMTFPFITAFQYDWITGINDAALEALRHTLTDIQTINIELNRTLKAGDVIEWTYDGKRVAVDVIEISGFTALTNRIADNFPSGVVVNLFWNSKDIKVIR